MLLVILFALGYIAIVFEHSLNVNKAATALLTGVLCWTVYISTRDSHQVNSELAHHIADIAQILFFLIGAMTIVELIDAHDGFEIITSRIQTRNRRRLLVVISVLSFFLSAVLDNLTTSIVMISLVRKLVASDDDRRYFGGVVIIAANSGGSWSPIGDVTTTMLWVGGQITSVAVMKAVLLPAFVSLLVPMLWILRKQKGEIERTSALEIAGLAAGAPSKPVERVLVFCVGAGVLIGVPVFKSVTHLPPFMGILLGLGLLWAVTELIHKRKNDEAKHHLSVAGALQRVDTQSVLFFLGILLAITALQSAGLLASLAGTMDRAIGNVDVITIAIGLSSSVIDNVPLVAAAQGMYTLAQFPPDHHFWLFLAYCAGTGGSILIIGSAAGIAVMGIQRITFGWYVRHMSLPALLGYLAGAVVYIATAAA